MDPLAFLRQPISRAILGGTVILLLLLGLGYLGFTWRPAPDTIPAFYTPGMMISRDDCIAVKMKNYARFDKQILQIVTAECEQIVQSIEGHEAMRKAWEQRQTTREAQPKPSGTVAPANPSAPPQIWR